MNKNIATLSAVVVATMLLSAMILAAPALSISNIQMPQIFNRAFADSVSFDFETEILPNGQPAYKLEGADTASIPGPTIIVEEGDSVTINGVDSDFAVDGLSGSYSSGSYTFSASSAGTYVYKDESSALVGLFGAVIVRAPDGMAQPFIQELTGDITDVSVENLDKEFVLFMVGSTFWGQEINSTGQTALWTNPTLHADEDDLVQFHVLSVGPGHTFHLHAHRWVESATNLNIIDTKLMEDGSATHVFTVRAGADVGPGSWQYHCHVFAHMEAGMHGVFHVGSTPDAHHNPTKSEAGASPYGGHPVLANGTIPGLVTFEISDEPGSWFRNTLDISSITKTRSLALAKPGDSVHFIMSDTDTVHTITSLLWPTGAANMPMDEVQSYKGGGITRLDDEGLYVFTCKIHPYMFGGVIVDDPTTAGTISNSAIGESLELDDEDGTLTLVTGLTFPTASDLGLRLLKTFFVATTPSNYKDYTQTSWNPVYPAVNVRASGIEIGTDLFSDRPGGGGLNGLLDFYFDEGTDPSSELINPPDPGVGEVWIDTQFEKTEDKTKPGTATAVNVTDWTVRKKVSLPDYDMNNPHNMWTDDNQQVIYQTEWFDNKLTTFDRESGNIISQIIVGEAPSHVMTRTDTGDIHVALNGEEGVAEILATTDPDEVERIIAMQGYGQNPTHPHAHWMSAEGDKMVTPNSFTGDSTLYGFNAEEIIAKPSTGALPIATGMTPDSSKYYVANLLHSTISVINMTDGSNIKTITLLDDYNATSLALVEGGWISAIDLTSGPLVVGALPIQTPVSPDGKWMVTANTLSGTLTITDVEADEVVTTLFCDPGCHGVNFGAKQGGGYYAYVSSKFSNALIVVDPNPDGDNNTVDATIVGKVLLVDPYPSVSDDPVSENPGMGGQGVLAIPNPYNGWIQAIPQEVLDENGWVLTAEQRNPNLY